MAQGRLEPEVGREALWACSACGACEDACPARVDVASLVQRGRERLSRRGLLPSDVREACGRFAVSGTPVDRDLSQALEHALASSRMEAERVAEVVYLPGCRTLVDEPEAVSAFLSALSLAGGRRVSLTPASSACCGMALWWAGDLEAFEVHARVMQARLRGAKRLVVHDPSCAHDLERRYAEVGVALDLDVVSAMDFFAAALDLEAPAPTEGEGAVLVESCRQAREGARGAALRVVRQAVEGRVEVVDSGCCGAGGAMPEAAPEDAAAMARDWIDRARSRGAARVLTCSPRCRGHLRRVDPSFEVGDPIAEWARR